MNLTKLAALKKEVTLYPHQERAVNRPGDSVIFAHAVGSGKTLSGLARFERLKEEGKAKKALVVVPASLRDNFGKEGVGKFTDSSFAMIGNKQETKKGEGYGAIDPNADYNILSYEMFRKDPEGILAASGADTIIADEFHRGKNEGTMTTDSLKQLKGKYNHFIGLTGSVVSNGISDVQPLVDIASGGEHRLGETKKEFDKTYLKRDSSKKYRDLHPSRRPIVGFSKEKELRKELGGYVDYVDYDDVKDLAKMPDKLVNITKVPLTKEQVSIYKGLLKDQPAVRKMVLNKRVETLKDEEAAKAFSKLVESRKLMNSVGSVKPGISLSESAEMTPKTKRLLDDLTTHLNETPDGQAVLLSHLITGGHDVLEQGLKDRDISYGKFLGKGNDGVTETSRQQDVEDYKNRKKRVMLISAAGGEGVSLNDTTWEGVLDPHYNPEKMNQMEARGIRSNGLSHRPKEERAVEVNRYLATMPKTLGLFKSRYRTPDELMYDIAQNKDQQNQRLLRLLKEEQSKQKLSKQAATLNLAAFALV